MGVGVRKSVGDIQENIVASREREFLLTGGSGSFAMLSLNWENRRKFHGLYIKSMSPPAKRFVILSGIKEFFKKQRIHPDTYIYPNKFITVKPEVEREIFLDDGFRIVYRGNLEIRPFFNYRHIYEVRGARGNARWNLEGNSLNVVIDGNKINVNMFGNYQFVNDPVWEVFEYDIDRNRLEDWRDYNFSPGRIIINGFLEMKIDGGASNFNQDFVVDVENDKEKRKFVIAGYPWFSFWTRDALVYTRYLIAKNDFNTARQVLLSIYSTRREDILPEFIDERTGQLSYSGLDGNLMFLSVLHEYIEKSGDWDILSLVDPEALIMPAIGRLDGNLFLHTKTWTDTIYREKPVEIQAFLFDALLSVSNMLESDDSARYESIAAELRRNFRKEYLDSEGIKDSMNDLRVRPNFLFTAYFNNKIVSPQKLRKSIKSVIDDLVTPFGLRSMSPDSPGYFGVYTKAHPESYHNGTVWAWLVGPLFEAVSYAYKDGTEYVREIVNNLENHRWSTGVIGQVNEIFDGDAPHNPRGCPAQAWSLSELERVRLALNSP